MAENIITPVREAGAITLITNSRLLLEASRVRMGLQCYDACGDCFLKIEKIVVYFETPSEPLPMGARGALRGVVLVT